MITRTLSCLLTATALATLPLESHAENVERAMNTCTQAFIEHLAATHAAANYRIENPAGYSSSGNVSAVHSPRRIELRLTATQGGSGAVLARADCTATRAGDLITLTNVPAGDQPKLTIQSLQLRD